MTLTTHEEEKLRQALAVVVDITPPGRDFEDLEQVQLQPAPATRRSRITVAAAVGGFVLLLVLVAPLAFLLRGSNSDQTLPTVAATVATAPVDEPMPDSPVTGSSVSDDLQPDRFAIVTDEWPTVATASASWGDQIAWDNPTTTEALVAKVDGSWLRDGIRLSVMTGDTAGYFEGTPETVSVAGVAVEVYVEGGSPTITTVVLPGQLTMTATGVDAVGFLEAAGGFPIEGAHLNFDGEVEFTVGALPDGYSVVVFPTRLPRGSVEAWTDASYGGGGDGISVVVGLRSPLFSAAQVGDLQSVDINGVDGWMLDQGFGSTVIWRVSDTTWASVGGGAYSPGPATVDDAIALARSLEFVDEATWTEHYNIDEPTYPPRNDGTFIGADQFRVVAAGQSTTTELGTLTRVQSQDELNLLLSSFEPRPDISTPDFENEIVVAFAVPDGNCDTPLQLLGFEQTVAGYIPRFDDEATRSCRLVLTPTTFVAAINSAALPPGSELRLPADDQYGYPDIMLEITQ